MSRGRWAALVAAGVVLVGAGTLAGLAHLVSTHSVRVLDAVSRGLGREVRAERLGVTLLGGPGVTLSGVTIADEPAAGTDEPLLAARRIALRVRVLPLLARRVVVARVEVDAPVVNLVRDLAGHLNAAALGRGGAGETSRPAAPSAAGVAAPPASGAGALSTNAAGATSDRSTGTSDPAASVPAIQLALVRLRDGTIRYRDRAGGQALELTEVALDAREPTFGGEMPVSFRARLADQAFRLDGILSEGVLDLSGREPSYHGSLRAGPGALGQIAIKSIAATMQARPPVLALESAAVELLGGTIQGSARLVSGGEGAGLTSVLDGRDLDLAALPVPADRPHPAGALTLHAEINGPAPGSQGFRRALTGTGSFAVADGRVVGVALGRALRDVLAPFLGSDVAARLRDRYPDLFGGDDLPFTRFAGSAQLAAGRISSDDLVLAGASYEARGAGSLGLDASLDLTLRLRASAALTDDLLGHTKARPVLVDADGQLSIPLRVRGTLHHPKVSPEPEFAATVARSLFAGTGLEAAAGTLLERLLGAKHGKGH